MLLQGYSFRNVRISSNQHVKLLERKYLIDLLHLPKFQPLDTPLPFLENISCLHLTQFYARNCVHLIPLLRQNLTFLVDLHRPFNLQILPYYLIKDQRNYQIHHKDFLLPS